MPRIAYILLAHKDPEGVVAQVRALLAAGDCVAIHFDANASAKDYTRLKDALDGSSGLVFAPRRYRCGWGEWSLVEASLATLRAALSAFPDATHFYMISGDCGAIKTAEYAHSFLESNEADFIESHDFFESDWIRTGLKAERLIYRHYVNERKRKWLFYRSLEVQKALGWTREIPKGLRVHIGSQWWCLRRGTVEQVLAFCEERPDVVGFFRTTWIPDETFFQTLVRHLIPSDQIRNRTLTFLLFTDYGLPATFYDDQYDMLLAQDALFARKISAGATGLRTRLGALYAETGHCFNVSGEGRRLYHFLAQRGREGRRFAPRFWEAEASLPRGRTLLIVACKKWHVAKRLAERVRQAGLMPALDYVFDENTGDLPGLGGIGSSLDKRHRHRRMLVNLLFRERQTDRLMLCLDPARLDMIEDFDAAPADCRVLEIACGMDDGYLQGHAMRVGLAGSATPADVMAALLPAIRADIRGESERLREAGLTAFHLIDETASGGENALSLARFLSISEEEAAPLLGGGDLFAD